MFGFSDKFTEKFKNHMWCAHVRVTPPGATQPTLDLFGHVPHGAASFLSGHNRSLAMGGTLGAPNYKNHFVLRLEEDAQGTGLPKSPHSYYSYYHDSSVAPTNARYEALEPDSFLVRRPDNVYVPVTFWRAQSFGFIMPRWLDIVSHVLSYVPNSGQAGPPMPIVYGERVETNQPPPRWRVDTRTFPPPPRMRYWATPQFDASNQLLTSPMVLAMRVPMDKQVAGDPRVAGENRHWQLARDFWEVGHHTQVIAALDSTNGGAYPVNLCFVDSAGRTLSTQQGAIPRRGVDSPLASAGYSSLDKTVLYGGGPVPARHYDDRMFDWEFGNHGTSARPAPLKYLEYPDGNPVTNIAGPFKAYSVQDPTTGATSMPPYRVAGSGPTFKIEGGQFTAACNDQVWGNSRRRDTYNWKASPSGLYGNNNFATDNWLLNEALDKCVGYQSAFLSFEAPVNQQIVVDQFTRMAEYIVTSGASGVPPLTPMEMRRFVVSPKLFSALDYQRPGITSDASLPAPVRQLYEVVNNANHAGLPQARANREIQFFKDLWLKLFDPSSSWHSHTVAGPGQPATVSLRDLWVLGAGNVAGHADQVFWYEDADNPATLVWVDMPHDFPLIDFLWTESEVSRGATLGPRAGPTTAPPQVLDAMEQMNFDALVNNVLIPWQANVPTADRYQNLPASTGACLLEMMRMGYSGLGPTYGRHWVRLRRGEVQFRIAPSGPSQFQWTPLGPLGQLPASSGTLERQHVAWSTLVDIAFPGTQYTSLLEGGLEPPYDALYGPNGQPRATLGRQETNALVEFFLKLGGHYIHPAQNDNSPSRKLARWQLAGHDPANFVKFLPGNYPLTAGLERVTAVRALLDTATFLNNSVPQFRQHFRTRAYDHSASNALQVLWPASPNGADYVGHGLRSVVWHEAAELSEYREFRGYQPLFMGMGGSYVTILAMFPIHGSAPGNVESYFWCTPGVEAMGVDPSRFSMHMAAHAANDLMPTHFHDFASNNPTPSATHIYP